MDKSEEPSVACSTITHDSPKMVTFVGSPPNAAMFSWTGLRISQLHFMWSRDTYPSAERDAGRKGRG